MTLHSDEISWPYFRQQPHIKKLPLNEQLQQYNAYINDYNAWLDRNTASGYASGKASSPVYTLGQSVLGGKVAYILQVSDIGYDPNTQHGLIVSTSDQGNTSWNNGSNITTGATGTAIGTGLANTNAIIAAQGAGTYAATLARNHNGGGYNDWYLPSKDELNALWTNRVILGGFTIANYWSSTEASSTNAFGQSLASDGTQNSFNKALGPYIRAIRSY
jgi:hypothetical protein